MTYLESAAREYARTIIDENKREGFIRGAMWFSSHLVMLMREHPMMDVASKATKDLSARIQIEVFWKTIEQIEQEGKTALKTPPVGGGDA